MLLDSCPGCYAGIMQDGIVTDFDRCMGAKIFCPELVRVPAQQVMSEAIAVHDEYLVCVVPCGGATVGVQLFDLLGRKIIILQPHWYSEGRITIRLPREQLSSGVYFCEVAIGTARRFLAVYVP